MSKNIFHLPTMKMAKRRYDDLDASAIDLFIYNCQPSDKVRAHTFRYYLEEAINSILDEQIHAGASDNIICNCSHTHTLDERRGNSCFACGKPLR